MEKSAENILLEKIRNDDVLAFRKLYDTYFQRLYIFSRKFTGEEQARDLIQDCFYKFWLNRKKIHIDVSVSAYLFAMVKNHCFHYLTEEQKKLKKEQNYKIRLQKEELEYFVQSEKSILEFDIRDRIERIISKLPLKCARVFRESRFEGLSNNEIATRHDISEKAVEKHITKALKIFREELKDLFLLFFLFSFQKNH